MSFDTVLQTPLRRISVPGGDVFHGMKSVDAGFEGFGEAYFSTVEKGYVKGWKRHTRMTLNFVVPCGAIQVGVVGLDGGAVRHFVLSPESKESYFRLTIGPNHWVAFGGVGEGLNLLLNLASIQHDPTESETLPLDSYAWNWND